MSARPAPRCDGERSSFSQERPRHSTEVYLLGARRRVTRGGQKRYGPSPPGARIDVCVVLNRSSEAAGGVDQTLGTKARGRGRRWGVPRALAGWRATPQLAPGLRRSAGARPSGTQGHLSPKDVGVRCTDLLKNRKKKSSSFNQNNPPGPRAHEYSTACFQRATAPAAPT